MLSRQSHHNGLQLLVKTRRTSNNKYFSYKYQPHYYDNGLFTNAQKNKLCINSADQRI